jgi:hypothetical protein
MSGAQKRSAYKDSIRNLEGRVHLEYISVDVRIILKWILEMDYLA